MDPRAIHPYVSAQHVMPLSPGPRGKNFCPGDARFGTSHVVCTMVELSRPTMTPTRACVCNGGGGGGGGGGVCVCVWVRVCVVVVVGGGVRG